MIAPTSDKTTYRLNRQEGLKYANTGDLWQFGVVSVFFSFFVTMTINLDTK